LIDVSTTDINMLFSAGPRVAFHATHHGVYRGGFVDIPGDAIGTRISLRIAGMLDTRNGEVAAARIFADKLGLYRMLRQSSLSRTHP
jgi:predicted ester cyclase